MSSAETVPAAGAQLSPHAVMKTAHELLVKWDNLKEREQLWSDLRAALNVLGQAIGWELPARLRLVGVVVQVVEVLANGAQARAVGISAQKWLESMKRQQTHGNIQPLDLLRELGRCIEGVDMPATAEDDTIVSEDLVSQVLDAARTISLHVETEALQKALVNAVIAKDMELAQQVLDELKLVFKFQAAAETEIEAHEKKPEILSPQRGSEYVDRIQIDDSLDDGEAPTQDVEDTLAAMMEMGAEAFPATQEEIAAEIVAPQMPLQAHGDKRKHSILDDAIEDDREMMSPTGGRLVLSRSQASPQSSRRNSLFDAPIRSLASEGQPAVLRESHNSNIFHDAEVPSGGLCGGKRRGWTTEEEQRLIAGHEKYGNRWGQIRDACGLKHRYGTQVRDKWVNLVKSGRVRGD